MRYCVYRMWKGSKIEEVLEYFFTYDEAIEYFIKVKRSKDKEYTVHVGEFV